LREISALPLILTFLDDNQVVVEEDAHDVSIVIGRLINIAEFFIVQAVHERFEETHTRQRVIPVSQVPIRRPIRGLNIFHHVEASVSQVGK
jgi:hypothetical protein